MRALLTLLILAVAGCATVPVSTPVHHKMGAEVGGYPNATSPLSGSERLLCDQAGVTSDCTPAQIAAYTTSTAGGVSTTGTPAAGELTQFSGATTITGGNLSGDCTTSNGLAVTCTKTNGVAFAPSATTDTTNASNITGGTLPAAVLPSVVPRWYHICSACSYTLFSTGATTNSVSIYTLPAAAIVQGIKIKQSTSFAGTGITAYTISVGIASYPTELAPAFDVYQAVSATALQLSSPMEEFSETATQAITATATSTGANLSAASAGVVDIWALISIAQ